MIRAIRPRIFLGEHACLFGGLLACLFQQLWYAVSTMATGSTTTTMGSRATGGTTAAMGGTTTRQNEGDGQHSDAAQ
jgi:hypothetical protein